MFNYVNDINKLSHYIIKNFCSNYKIAIDATLGNGYDTDFLSTLFEKVYAFEVQSLAINNYSKKQHNINNIVLINDSHENLKTYINKKVDCIMYNLGFLPKGNKNITTKVTSTIKSIKTSLKILNSNGIITIGVYPGHKEGKKEEKAILNLVKNLPKNTYGVMLHTFLNRTNNPPSLIIIEKK